MIEVRDLTFGYGRRQTPVFEGFSWAIEPGGLWAVVGASGCGKTTLLMLLAGLALPHAGAVCIAGAPIRQPRPETGLILQDHGLLPWATVRENAGLGLAIRRFYGPDGRHAPPGAGLDAGEARHRVEHWLERLGIAELADKYPAQLSGGQRQRTAIARTLALGPDLLLMDEPFSALDAATREDLQGLVLELRREAAGGGSLTTVIVTHGIDEAVLLGRSILVLGAPPNRAPRVIANPGAASPGWRREPQFAAMAEQVRILLRETA